MVAVNVLRIVPLFAERQTWRDSMDKYGCAMDEGSTANRSAIDRRTGRKVNLPWKSYANSALTQSSRRQNDSNVDYTKKACQIKDIRRERM